MKLKQVCRAMLWCAIVVVFTSGFAGIVEAKDKVYRWRMQSFLPAGGDGFNIQQKFCDDVRKASNGRLDIRFYGAGQLMPVLETWEATARGVVEMNFSFGAYWTGKTRMAGVSVGLPFTTKTMHEHMALLYEEGLEDLVRKEYDKHGLYLLKIAPIQRSVMVTRFPVGSLNDLKGKKMRAGGVEAQAIAASGINSVFFPVPEVYQALDTGVVDGVIMGGIDASRRFSFYEVTKHIVHPSINVATEEVHVNKGAWEQLPDDLKNILSISASRYSLARSSYSAHREMIDLEFLQENGMTVQSISESDYETMAKATHALYEEWAAQDPAFAEAWTMIKKFMNYQRF